MKDDKKLELLLERFYNRFNQYNTKVLEKLGEAIKKFDGVSPSMAHQIAQELKYGTDIDDLMDELSKLSGKSIKDIEEAFDIVAEENVAFAEVYAKAKNMEFVDYKNNEQLKRLVKVMSFGSPRFANTIEWEIIRECSKSDVIVLGGKEKLWNFFLKKYNPKSVLSYCDYSKFNGSSYLKLGFKKSRLNKPGFVWYDENNRNVYWRNPYKHKEYSKKFIKVWDCGQLVFLWQSSK